MKEEEIERGKREEETEGVKEKERGERKGGRESGSGVWERGEGGVRSCLS